MMRRDILNIPSCIPVVLLRDSHWPKLNGTWSVEDKSGSTVFKRKTGCVFLFRLPQSGVRYVRLTVRGRNGAIDSLRRAVRAEWGPTASRSVKRRKGERAAVRAALRLS